MLFFLQFAGEFLVFADAVRGAVGVVAVERALVACAGGVRSCAAVAGRCARGWCFAGWVDGLCGFLPGGLLGVEVYEEPFVVLVVPYGFPALRNLWWRRALCVV